MTPLPTWVDAYYPPCGPCAFCGCDDKRHRLTDAIVDAVTAGDSIEDTAANFKQPIEFVRRLVAERPKVEP